MNLYIKVVEGPGVGRFFKVTSSVIIGRNNGTILIDDPKISGTHAKIEKTSFNDFVLVDLESSNGILVDEKKVMRLPLVNGTEFQLGKTKFLVTILEPHLLEEMLKDETNPEALKDILEKEFALLQFETHSYSKENESEGFLEKKENLTRNQPVASFEPVIQLIFLSGIQTGQSLFLGYGPRQVGAQSFDIELYEPLSPDLAFELLPDEKGVVFSTYFPERVLLNNSPTKRKLLQNHDKISIGKTLIEVRFINQTT